MSDPYSRIAMASARILETCGYSGGEVHLIPLNTHARRPHFPGRPDESGSSGPKHPRLAELVDRHLARIRAQLLQAYESLCRQLVVASDQPAAPLGDVQGALCQALESRYRDHVKRVDALLAKAVSLSSGPRPVSRSTAFSPVRTWFQNKRNRGNKSRRSGSTSTLESAITGQAEPERRVISALPRRFQHKASTDVGPDGPAQPTRVVRGLPKRKAISPAESPAKSEASSLDSIPSSGGFLSPLNATTSHPPNITFPNDHNCFPQTAQPWTVSGDGILEWPVDMDGLMPWDTAFNFDLGNFERSIQAALDDPTLSGSPALSYGASTDMDGNPIGTPEDEYLKLGLSELDGDELLQMLNDAEFIPAMNEILEDCTEADNVVDVAGEWTAINGTGPEMQMEETVVTVEEVGSSWSGSSGGLTPSLGETMLSDQALPAVEISTVGNAVPLMSQSGHESVQEKQHSISAPSVIITGPTPSPGERPVQISHPPHPQQHYSHYETHPPTSAQYVPPGHEVPSYQASGQVEHMCHAASLPHIYYAAPYLPQTYPPGPQESTWIVGALPFDNVYAQQPVQMIYGPPPHGIEFSTEMFQQQAMHGQVMADGGVWPQ